MFKWEEKAGVQMKSDLETDYCSILLFSFNTVRNKFYYFSKSTNMSRAVRAPDL